MRELIYKWIYEKTSTCAKNNQEGWFKVFSIGLSSQDGEAKYRRAEKYFR